MGGCLNSTKGQACQITIQTEVEIDLKPLYEVKIIPNSYFYHLLRRQIYSKLKQSISKCEIIDISDDVNIMVVQKVDVKSFSKNFKILYDHKQLIVIDNKTKKGKGSMKLEDLMTKFSQTNIKPSKLLIVNRIHQFLKQYPFFIQTNLGQNNIFQTFNIPILAIDSKDILINQVKPFKIFVHNSSMINKNKEINPKFYQQLFSINNNGTIEFDKVRQINLKKTLEQENTLLIIHNSNQQMQLLSKQIIKQISLQFDVSSQKLTQYLSLRLPIVVQKNVQLQDIGPTRQKKQLSKTTAFIQTKQNELQRLFLNYYNQSGSLPLTDQIFKLLTRLLQNLTKEDNNEIWRSIKPAKAQYSQRLLKFKSGYDLIEAIGFYKKGQVYYNGTQNKYLKLFKTDLPLAYREMQEKIK